MLNKKLVLLSMAVTASFILSGCGAKGPQFSSFEKPEAHMGMVYVYRPSNITGYLYSNTIREKNNQKILGTLKDGGYIAREMIPGNNTLEQTFAGAVVAKLDINVQENDIVCVKNYLFSEGYYSEYRLENVDKNLCKLEIKETSHSIE